MWADKDKELAGLARALDTRPHELVYWLGYEGMESFNETKAIFHSHVDAAQGIPAKGVDTSDFEPPGADIISDLYRVESVILTMMNRTFDGGCVDERRHLYYQLLQYWLGVFKKYRPEVIIFPVEPHGVYDYLVYELAKLFSVKTFFFNETRVSDRLLPMNDFTEGSRLLLQEIEKNKGRDFTLEDISPDIREYYRKRAVTERERVPAYVDFLQNKYSLARRLSMSKMWGSVRAGTFFKKMYHFLFNADNARFVARSLVALTYTLRSNLKKEYHRLQAPPDMDKKFIYVPLQVQPERSTSPVGDMFADQILMLEILSASLPDGWVIYVKEHPVQWVRIGVRYSSSRYRGYYERIAGIKHVQLIPIDTSSYSLMDKSEATVTVTGAPGWEAILHGKPAIVFGYPWYKDCPGVSSVRDVGSCQRAFARIAGGFKLEQLEVINYLKSLDDATTHGYIAESNKNASHLNRKENMESIRGIVLAELVA